MKMTIVENDVRDWVRTTWSLYASQMYNRELLRLWINCKGIHKVSYGKNTLYEGTDRRKAIAAWDAA